jgi:ATP-dependent DNA helicase RecG
MALLVNIEDLLNTDEERSFFMLEIPCNKEFVNSNLIDFITVPMSQVVSQVKPIHIDADFQQIKSQISQVLSQVVSQDKPLNLDLLTKVYMKLTAPMSMHELMIEFKQTNRGRFKRSCLDILLDADLITMTIPDKPNSSKQRYKQVQRF